MDNKGFEYIIAAIEPKKSEWFINYAHYAILEIHNILKANIIIIILGINLKDIVNSKIKINIKPIIVFIVFVIILLVALGVKITMENMSSNEALLKAISDRKISKKEALKRYQDASIGYVERLKLHKEDLVIQNIANVIIYLLDIICIFVVYRKILN